MKILSINLWFEKYANKTLAQLASFRFFGYETYVATVISTNSSLKYEVYQIKEHEKELVVTHELPQKPLGFSYFTIFKSLFEYCAKEDFSVIYIRRLMSKLFFAVPSILKNANHIPIVYEIPTYPYDKPGNLLLYIRDFLEQTIYRCINRFIALTVVVLRSNVKLKKNWIRIENGIDISNYMLNDIPVKTNTIKFIAIANLASWHRYDRMLQAIKDYDGIYKIHFTIVSPANRDCEFLKEIVTNLDLKDIVTFIEQKSLMELGEIARGYHIGVGQLSDSSENTMLMSSLKNKDYCALGLPFFSTCPDNSFNKEFPYFYLLQYNEKIDLKEIINWYEKIYENKDYKSEMFQYAKENLQYFSLVKQIEKRIL